MFRLIPRYRRPRRCSEQDPGPSGLDQRAVRVNFDCITGAGVIEAVAAGAAVTADVQTETIRRDAPRGRRRGNGSGNGAVAAPAPTLCAKIPSEPPP